MFKTDADADADYMYSYYCCCHYYDDDIIIAIGFVLTEEDVSRKLANAQLVVTLTRMNQPMNQRMNECAD